MAYEFIFYNSFNERTGQMAEISKHLSTLRCSADSEDFSMSLTYTNPLLVTAGETRFVQKSFDLPLNFCLFRKYVDDFDREKSREPVVIRKPSHVKDWEDSTNLELSTPESFFSFAW